MKFLGEYEVMDLDHYEPIRGETSHTRCCWGPRAQQYTADPGHAMKIERVGVLLCIGDEELRRQVICKSRLVIYIGHKLAREIPLVSFIDPDTSKPMDEAPPLIARSLKLDQTIKVASGWNWCVEFITDVDPERLWTEDNLIALRLMGERLRSVQ